MISKSNEFTRRILHFPAVRPCESVSLSTLLFSLINLAHSIYDFKSTTFLTNKKNARNSIHSIETLAVFLQEIRHDNSRFEPSIILCLSELHFIFQKIRFLLEDCARNDARLWILMNSEKVSSHFREQMRAITVALDVFPSSGSDIAVEVEELVDLVRKQALKTKFEVERDDRRAMRRVHRIIGEFQNGIAPKSSDLKRVLEYLGIRSWNDCNNEIRTLEIEASRECDQTAEKGDFQFLSSLMSFLIYCRCTIFVEIDHNVRNCAFSRKSGKEMITCLNPDDFRCPITLEIMTDPVTISTGHTYDRASIVKWFDSGNHTCPITGERLLCVDLVPNHTLKRLIKQYCHENGIPFAESSSCGQNRNFAKSSRASLAAEEAMKLLSSFLVNTLLAGTNEEQCKASFEIRLLTNTSVFNRSCLVEGHAIPPLLDLLCSINPGTQENAMAGLLNLSKHSESKKIIAVNGGFDRIVNVLNNGLKIEARQHAAGALFYLASMEEYRRVIGRIPGAIPGLIGLIRAGPRRGKKNGLVSILGLLMYPENHWRVLESGLVPLLVNLLKSVETTEDFVTDSLAVLATLAENLDGTMAIISAGILLTVVEILSSSNSRTAKEYCVSLLLALCINAGADVVRVLVKSPSLMVTLYGLIADGGPRSSRKAGSLIRILHAFNEKSFSSGSGLAQEQFVHVW